MKTLLLHPICLIISDYSSFMNYKAALIKTLDNIVLRNINIIPNIIKNNMAGLSSL